MRTEHESIHQRLVSATKAPGRTGHYPTATANGAMHYEETVSLGALRAAFGKAFEGRDLDLDTRVVYLHGVPSGTALPPSVASLGPIPAHVTLPIACGEIRRVR